jgi:hypothetical protein
MPEAIWTVRRYQLPKYNKKSLAAEIKSWVKQRQGRIRYVHGSLFSSPRTNYEIAPPGSWPLWLSDVLGINLRIHYEDSVLFVYVNKEAFPNIFQDIHETVIIPYIKQYGGFPLDETPHMLDMDLRPWLKRHFGSQDVHDVFVQALKEGNAVDSPLLGLQPQTPKVASIRLDAEVETAQTASEEVSVPPGVTIKVKRSRTIEHTVDIDWHISGGINIDSGFKPIISASIRGEIGQSQGRAYRETETLEYEVALSGEITTRYRLTWTDVWRKGVAEFRMDSTTQALPFRFREWTKLEVYPLGV